MNAKALIKDSLKNSSLFPALIYLRYWLSRYISKKYFTNYKTYGDSKIEKVDEGINFFGYYNISPENINGDILFLKVSAEKERGSLFEPASIMLKKQNGTVIKLTETKAWNWQQGCMFQWLGPTGKKIIYNDYEAEKDHYIAKVINTAGNLLNTYEHPVNNVSKNGDFALSLNYDRLAYMRPDYGYFNRRNPPLTDNDNDGIWHINFDTGKTKLIISLKQLINIFWTATMEGAEHKVNHIDIAPNGERFMFLHRWIGPHGRFMRLVTVKPDGNDISILNGDTMISHSCWLNNCEILSFCNYKGVVGYFRFNILGESPEFFFEQMPKVDGHPSISPDGKWIVTDTYPTLSRMSFLLLYNMKDDKLIELGRFYQPLKYQSEMRIDLHPKWSMDGDKIFFESGHSGRRRLYRMDVSKIIHE
ncbi:MAG TPA: glycosyl transferase [Bacteroidetes bacterium]|nr:glycosyl transferase [Bacteroidota bacterium]